MICPKCKELNQKSTVSVGMSYTHTVYINQFYDEEGNWHGHHPSTSTNMRCSKGHDIAVTSNNKCDHCDFGSEESVTATDSGTLSVQGSSGTLVLSTNSDNTVSSNNIILSNN
jgi:hypothetical protein